MLRSRCRPLLLNASRIRLLLWPETSPSLCISPLHCQVVAGSKTFTLLPPADIFRMRLRQYASATYKPQGAGAADQVGGSRFGRVIQVATCLQQEHAHPVHSSYNAR